MSHQPDLNALGQNPQVAALMKDPAALKAMLSSPEVQKLMALLTQQSGGQEKLRGAARSASQGDTAALSALLGNLSQSKEGRDTLNKIQGQLNK
jgi:hypothetical protein